MTFKPNAVKRTVTGTFQRQDGVPSQGKIYIELSAPILGREENVIYTMQKIEVELDEAGSFSKPLAVTDPGLTVEELEELVDIQSARAQNLEDLAAVQLSINNYLQKLAGNLAVTEAETTQYNADVQTKKDLQVVSIDLSKQYLELLDKQEKMSYNVVRMKITTDFTNPISKRKIEFILPKGTEPIDIADLPRI